MHHPRRTKRGLIALAVAAALVVPAAIAWACNPQAQLTPNKASYSPGERMTVSGSFFPRSTPIKVTVSGGASGVATTNPSGAFQMSLATPTSPGTYTITATKADGTAQSGLPKVASFQVVAPAATRAPAPATSPAPPNNTQQGGNRALVEPGVTRSPTRSVTGIGDGGSGGGGGGQPQGGGSTGGVAGGGTIVTGTTGVPVFAGSVAPAQPTFGSAPAAAAAPQQGTTTAGKGSAARSTRGAAADSDVWTGFANGRTPSLTSDAADAPDSGTGSGLGLGIGLLAVGLLALVAGLTAAEVRRRRASV